MKPSIGRIVIFTDTEHPNNDATSHPAIVHNTRGDDGQGDTPALDLSVFFRLSGTGPRENVPHKQQAGGGATAYWDWPEHESA